MFEFLASSGPVDFRSLGFLDPLAYKVLYLVQLEMSIDWVCRWVPCAEEFPWLSRFLIQDVNIICGECASLSLFVNGYQWKEAVSSCHKLMFVHSRDKFPFNSSDVAFITILVFDLIDNISSVALFDDSYGFCEFEWLWAFFRT